MLILHMADLWKGKTFTLNGINHCIAQNSGGENLTNH